MLRLGLALVGTALLLHSRKVKAASDKEQESENPESSSESPFPGIKLPGEPVLDPAITGNPLLIGPAGAIGDLGWNLGLGSSLGQTPGVGFGGVPQLLPQGLGSGQTVGMNTPDQLSAAHHMYQQIVGAIPSAVAQKIRDVKALADFQARSAKKVVGFHRRVIKKIFG